MAAGARSPLGGFGRSPVFTSPRSGVSSLRAVGVNPRGSLPTAHALHHVRTGWYGRAPRLGVPGYHSSFVRHVPVHYAPRPYSFFRHCYPVPYRHYGHYGHSGFGFSFGFGYSSYPRYPVAYYPTYYQYPLYPVAYPVYAAPVIYPSVAYLPPPVVVEQPIYYDQSYVGYSQQYGGDQYVGDQYVGNQYVGDQYVGGQPDVAYEDGYTSQPPTAYQPTPTYRDSGPDAARQTFEDEQELRDAGLAEQPTAGTDPGREMVEPDQGQLPQLPPAAAVTPNQHSTHMQPAPGPADDAPEGSRAQELPAAQQDAPPTEQAEDNPELAARIQATMEGGTEAFAGGRYTEAVGLFQEAVDADPRNVDGLLALAAGRFAVGEYSAAAKAVRDGVNLYPPIVDSAFDLRERYGRRADFPDQLGRLERHVRDHRDDADARVVLGFIRHFSHQRELSEQVFNEVKRGGVAADADIAEVFLSAIPLEQALAAERKAGDQARTQGEGSPQAPAAQAPTSPAPANPAAAAPATPAIPAPPADALFNGRTSISGQHPREHTVVDGILVRLKATDSNPVEAQFEVEIGQRLMKVRHFRPGAKVTIKGASGQNYRMTLTEVDNKSESAAFFITREDASASRPAESAAQ